MQYQRDVFCARCGAKIDTISTPTREHNGQVEAMILGESRAIHKSKTGCRGIDNHGSAWSFGPWCEVPADGEDQ